MLTHHKDGVTREFLKGDTRGLRERKVGGGRAGDGGKIEWKLLKVISEIISI